MTLYEEFANALPLADFLARYGTADHAARWKRTHEQIALTPPQRELLAQFKRETHVLVLAGAWCGDCSGQCPAFERFAEAAPVLKVRYIDRNERADAQLALKICGGDRVPVAVFFSEDGFEVARYGERTLSQYRTMVAQTTGASCSTGLNAAGDPRLAALVQDWLDQFERVQWILRLSARLRQKHGD